MVVAPVLLDYDCAKTLMCLFFCLRLQKLKFYIEILENSNMSIRKMCALLSESLPLFLEILSFL